MPLRPGCVLIPTCPLGQQTPRSLSRCLTGTFVLINVIECHGPHHP
ncbi:hypothetical protein EPIB1_2001 [Tritonibacter mobilis]|nr:hypothetical protein EPIB1_2001 [Tritonibacter mobilis]